MSTDWRERISVDPDLHHGEACVRGTRVPVRVIVGSLAEGHEPAAILREYPQLRLDDVHAALAYTAEVLQNDLLVPLVGGTRANAGGHQCSPKAAS
jgi:uncharacterized protein (DUF433 family)